MKERQGLPDDWSILLDACHGRTPRRLRSLLVPYVARAAAFQEDDPLGHQYVEVFEAAFPWPISSCAYASPSWLPTPSQGSLPTCGTALWSGGIRTRWTEISEFQELPSSLSFQTSLSWSQRRVARAGFPARALSGSGLGDFHHPALPLVRLADPIIVHLCRCGRWVGGGGGGSPGAGPRISPM